MSLDFIQLHNPHEPEIMTPDEWYIENQTAAIVRAVAAAAFATLAATCTPIPLNEVTLLFGVASLGTALYEEIFGEEELIQIQFTLFRIGFIMNIPSYFAVLPYTNALSLGVHSICFQIRALQTAPNHTP